MRTKAACAACGGRRRAGRRPWGTRAAPGRGRVRVGRAARNAVRAPHLGRDGAGRDGANVKACAGPGRRYVRVVRRAQIRRPRLQRDLARRVSGTGRSDCCCEHGADLCDGRRHQLRARQPRQDARAKPRPARARCCPGRPMRDRSRTPRPAPRAAESKSGCGRDRAEAQLPHGRRQAASRVLIQGEGRGRRARKLR